MWKGGSRVERRKGARWKERSGDLGGKEGWRRVVS